MIGGSDVRGFVFHSSRPNNPSPGESSSGAGIVSGKYPKLTRRSSSTNRFFHASYFPRSGVGTLAIGTAGAYGAVQAGTYNTRLLVPEVLVDGDRFAIVRARRSYDELIGLDTVPEWLKTA